MMGRAQSPRGRSLYNIEYFKRLRSGWAKSNLFFLALLCPRIALSNKRLPAALHISKLPLPRCPGSKEKNTVHQRSKKYSQVTIIFHGGRFKSTWRQGFLTGQWRTTNQSRCVEFLFLRYTKLSLILHTTEGRPMGFWAFRAFDKCELHCDHAMSIPFILFAYLIFFTIHIC